MRGLAALAALAWAAAACDDPFAEFFLPVPLEPTQVVLVDFLSGSLQDRSAFDVLRARTVRVDQSGQWDFLFSIDEAGAASLSPFGAVASRFSEAGVQPVSESFEGLRQAPVDGYLVDVPLDIAEGDVLAVVSRRDPNVVGRCRRYAKIEILTVDRSEGTLTFRHLINPNCEDRVLVPGEHGTP